MHHGGKVKRSQRVRAHKRVRADKVRARIRLSGIRFRGSLARQIQFGKHRISVERVIADRKSRARIHFFKFRIPAHAPLIDFLHRRGQHHFFEVVAAVNRRHADFFHAFGKNNFRDVFVAEERVLIDMRDSQIVGDFHHAVFVV